MGSHSPWHNWGTLPSWKVILNEPHHCTKKQQRYFVRLGISFLHLPHFTRWEKQPGRRVTTRTPLKNMKRRLRWAGARMRKGRLPSFFMIWARWRAPRAITNRRSRCYRKLSPYLIKSETNGGSQLRITESVKSPGRRAIMMRPLRSLKWRWH